MISIVYRRNGQTISVRQWESQEAMQRERDNATAPLTFAAKVARLATELRRWQATGYKLAPRSERKRRAALCQTCSFWRPAGNWGLGECGKCGCTKAKVWLATTSCPLHPPKWTAVQAAGSGIATPLQ